MNDLMARDEIEAELIALAACIPNIASNPASLSEARIRAAKIIGMTYSEICGDVMIASVTFYDGPDKSGELLFYNRVTAEGYLEGKQFSRTTAGDWDRIDEDGFVVRALISNRRVLTVAQQSGVTDRLQLR